MRSRGRFTPRRKQSNFLIGGERGLESREWWASWRINHDDGDRLTSAYPTDLAERRFNDGIDRARRDTVHTCRN